MHILRLLGVTRFGEILPLWRFVKCLWQFLWLYLELGTIQSLCWQILFAIGQIIPVLKGQIFIEWFCHLVTLLIIKIFSTLIDCNRSFCFVFSHSFSRNRFDLTEADIDNISTLGQLEVFEFSFKKFCSANNLSLRWTERGRAWD